MIKMKDGKKLFMEKFKSSFFVMILFFSVLLTVNFVNAEGEFRVEEFSLERDGKNIYGELYLPNDNSPLPLVILSHGYGGDHNGMRPYAELFARNGLAAYLFDFMGGGFESKSDGTMTEMSVLTEAADLNTAISTLRERPEIDASQIFLLGNSQGGFVSTYVAGMRPDEIAGLVVVSPYYVMQDILRDAFPNTESIPETFTMIAGTVGRIYAEDALSFDIYDVMRNYPGKVLIVHGTEDGIAPISYSERAAEVFPDAQFVSIVGAGHNFKDDNKIYSEQTVLDFVKSLLKEEKMGLSLRINETNVAVAWENNQSVEALKELMKSGPLMIRMSPYGGFEQVGPIGQSLPRNDVQTVTGPGDIVLYSGNQVVVFYGSNSWAYTRLGHITDKSQSELTQLLSGNGVVLTFEIN